MDLLSSFAIGVGIADFLDPVFCVDMAEVVNGGCGDLVLLNAELCGSGEVYAAGLDVAWEAWISVRDLSFADEFGF